MPQGMDYRGSIFLPKSGGAMSGELITVASAAVVGAGLNLPHGVVPNSPVNGDIWTTMAGLYARINGGTVGPFGTGSTDKGYLWIPAGAITPDTCAGLAIKDSDPNIFDYLAFDGGTDEYGTFTLSLADWDLSTIKAKFVWAASAAMTNGHTVIWGLNCYAVSDGDTVDVAFNTGAVMVSDVYATSDETGPIQKTSAATAAITVQGTPSTGDVIHCRVSRDADTDTSTIDAWLVGIMIEYGKTTPTAW